jgi:Domain of unknown function (DUF4333)
MPRSRGFGLLLACTVVVVAACSGGSDTLDGKDVEQAISKQLRKEFAGAPVGATNCPKEIKKKTGDEFSCTATVGNEAVPIVVTQTGKDPGYRAERHVAVLDVVKIQNFVQTQYDQTVGVQVTAACAPGKAVLVAEPQTMISCTVTDSVGTTDTVDVLVNDSSGNISIGTI